MDRQADQKLNFGSVNPGTWQIFYARLGFVILGSG